MYTFEVEEMTSVSDVDSEDVIVTAGKGYIEIIGNANAIEVYDAQGKLISQDETYVTCQAGIYIVKVDGKVTKVIVK